MNELSKVYYKIQELSGNYRIVDIQFPDVDPILVAGIGLLGLGLSPFLKYSWDRRNYFKARRLEAERIAAKATDYEEL